MDAYCKGLTGDAAAWAVKQQKGCQKVSQQVMMQIAPIVNGPGHYPIKKCDVYICLASNSMQFPFGAVFLRAGPGFSVRQKFSYYLKDQYNYLIRIL
jgi:hypothetical protein